MTHIEEITNNIKEWTKENFGSEFKFRPHQLEAIVSIVNNIVDDNAKHVHIIEAPTGAGKSNIFMIAAGVLNKYYKRNSYILCSDLFLFKQYKEIIDKHNLEFGALMGQTGNYVCERNGNDVRNGECRIAKMSWTSLANDASVRRQYNFECAERCQYLHDRIKAQRAGVTLMTYQLFLYMLNIVAPMCTPDTCGKGGPPFKERDIIFCDECHNIPSIIQSQYGPTIRYEHLKMFEELYNYNQSLFQGLFAEDTKAANLKHTWADTGVLGDEFNKYWYKMTNASRSQKDDYDSYIGFMQNIVNRFEDTVEELEDNLAIMRQNNMKISKQNYELYKSASWYRNFCCLLNDFGTAISDCGPEYLIKQINVRNSDNELVVNYNCVKEDYMCAKYLLSKTDFAVMTSATVGDRESFEENVGTRYLVDPNTVYERIPSTFDFSNSPVYVSTQTRFNYDNRFIALRNISNAIYSIVRNIRFRGIIQTGSYENAMRIYNDAPSDIKARMYVYQDSKDKENVMFSYKMDPMGILVGPTLIEGVDLPDDLCRYIIIAKVPFPNLADKLVNAKRELFPKWYTAETANSVIQGIGRGVRNPNDWCHTFILDACFLDLYRKTKEQFPNEFHDRLKIH